MTSTEPAVPPTTPPAPRTVGRRGFLATAGAVVGATAVVGARPTPAHAQLATNPFTPMGVASGDADATSLVLWTRLAPEPTDPGSNFGMGSRTEMTVSLRVALTAGGLDSVATCVHVSDHRATAGDAFSVHALVEGLTPGTAYVYRFTADGYTSPVGRTRTQPASGTATVRFAVINCQNAAGPSGPLYFNAMNDLVANTDVDFVVFLGDYIYEFGRSAHLPPEAVTNLAGYRTRYGQYRLRESLKELHRKFPVYVVPDDHEFFNDVKGGELTNFGRWNAALRVFWENLPLRGRPAADAAGQQHLQLHRRIRCGDTLELFLTDIRQYASSNTLLGNRQENDLFAFCDESSTRFSAIGTQTPMTSYNGQGGIWKSRPAVRGQVTDRLRARKQATPQKFNPVVLSGDFHVGLVSHVQADPENVRSALVATEFTNAPMTSGTTTDWKAKLANGDGGPGFRAAYGYGSGSDFRQYNGLMVCQVSADAWRTTYKLGNQVDQPGGQVTMVRTWNLPYGGAVGSVSPG